MIEVTPQDVFDGARFFRRFCSKGKREYLVTRLMTGLATDGNPKPYKFRVERQGILVDSFSGDAEQVAKMLNNRHCQSDVEVISSIDVGKEHLVHAIVKGMDIGIRFVNYYQLANEGVVPIVKGVTYHNDGTVTNGIYRNILETYFESIWGTAVDLFPRPEGGYLVVT